jgi:hypothetical protein
MILVLPMLEIRLKVSLKVLPQTRDIQDLLMEVIPMSTVTWYQMQPALR